MTAKKDLKRRVRERMKATGEPYTVALEHVRAPKCSLIEPEPRDLTELAKHEGFDCVVEVGRTAWEKIVADERSADAWFRLVLEKLRQLLVASIGEPGADKMRGYLVHGATIDRTTGAALARVFSFLRKVESGVRGVSPDGSIAALDIPSSSGRSRLVLFRVHRQGWADTERTALTLQVDPMIDTPADVLHRFQKLVVLRR
ncbi:MAG TPA: hypothetical protein VM925_08795 [Labilithrix sp.]|nr:hypothetical protein [Labilithrix sp.]